MFKPINKGGKHHGKLMLIVGISLIMMDVILAEKHTSSLK